MSKCVCSLVNFNTDYPERRKKFEPSLLFLLISVLLAFMCGERYCSSRWSVWALCLYCVCEWLCVHRLRVHSASLPAGSINRNGTTPQSEIPLDTASLNNNCCERDVQWPFSVFWDYGSSSPPPFVTDKFSHSHIFLPCLFTKTNKIHSNILSSLLLNGDKVIFIGSTSRSIIHSNTP